jgi:steroid 5-alpha reductase family enzyme
VQVLSSRQKLLALAVLLWASRLGSFLFARIRRHGGVDDRFTAVKPDLARFSRFWGIQVFVH